MGSVFCFSPSMWMSAIELVYKKCAMLQCGVLYIETLNNIGLLSGGERFLETRLPSSHTCFTLLPRFVNARVSINDTHVRVGFLFCPCTRFRSHFLFLLVEGNVRNVDVVCTTRSREKIYKLPERKTGGDRIRALVTRNSYVPANIFPFDAARIRIHEREERLPHVAIQDRPFILSNPSAFYPSHTPQSCSVNYVGRICIQNDIGCFKFFRKRQCLKCCPQFHAVVCRMVLASAKLGNLAVTGNNCAPSARSGVSLRCAISKNDHLCHATSLPREPRSKSKS